MVGAVLVRDGQVVGDLPRGGRAAHAEALALAAAGAGAAGATCYVTLEPCATTGGPRRAPTRWWRPGWPGWWRPWPTPTAGRRGRAGRLRAAGVAVTVGTGAEAAEDQNAAYLTHRRLGRPRITLKAAASLDGKVAAADGTSQWITGPAARPTPTGCGARPTR